MCVRAETVPKIKAIPRSRYFEKKVLVTILFFTILRSKQLHQLHIRAVAAATHPHVVRCYGSLPVVSPGLEPGTRIYDHMQLHKQV